jgi:hypothetical protein
MPNALSINNNGECINVQIKKKGAHIYKNDTRLHVHFEENDLLFLSEYAPEDLLHEDTRLCTFSLPPPLNAYVYPENIIVVKGCSDKISSLSKESFVEYCSNCNTEMKKSQNDLAVYDVPLEEFVNECDEDSEEDEENFEHSDEEEDCVEEEEDWEDFDENAPS